jgi:NitT/TauT family transport system ATP-binding protein
MAPLAPELTLDIRRKVFPAVGQRDQILVLRDVSVAVAPRSFVVITGPSGCGKSTMLNIIAGLDRDFDGRVQFRAPDSRLAFVFQTPRLLPWRTVAENIALVFARGDPRVAAIPEMLERVGLAGAEHAYPERLSLGMQRRVALARAFILEPDILLMDEPFVSLDDPTAQDLRQLLIELWSRRPTTVLFVTHDRFEAVMLGTRILRLSGASATLAQDAAVALSPGERLCPDKVRAEQRRIFGNT